MVYGLHRLVGTSRAHLSQAGESYFEHLRFALGVGAMMAAAGLACTLHALVPALCRDTASRTIRSLGRLLEDRSVLAETVTETAPATAFSLLLSLSLTVAALFWMLGASAVVALPLTLLAFALPVAALAVDPDLDGRPAADDRAYGSRSLAGLN